MLLLIFIVFKKILKPGSVTKFGRHEAFNDDPDAIRLAGYKISKTQFQVILGDPIVIDDIETRTPIKLLFESKAATIVNGDTYRLEDSNEKPFEKHFNESTSLEISLKCNKGTKAQINLEWIPFNVVTFQKKIMIGTTIQNNPLPGFLQKLFDDGVDLRITDDPLLATHYLTLNDTENHLLRISLLRAIPILNTVWADYIFDHRDDLDEWLFGILQEQFIPHSIKGDNSYLVKNEKRPNLLSTQLVLLFKDENESPQKIKRITEFARCLGATISIFETSKYIQSDIIDEDNLKEDIKLEFQQHSVDKCFAMRNNSNTTANVISSQLLDHFFENHGSEIVSIEALFQCVKDVSIDKLKPFQFKINNSIISSIDNTSKHELESQSQLNLTQRRKRRRIEKASGLDFFNFASTPTQTSNVKEPEPFVTKQSNSIPEDTTIEKEKDDEVTVQSNEEKDQKDIELAHLDNNSMSIPKSNDEDTEERKERVSKIEKNVDNNSEIIEEEHEKKHEEDLDSKVIDDRDDKKRNHVIEVDDNSRTKRIKPTPRIPKFMPQVSFVDAIKLTKQKQLDASNEQLGTNKDDFDVDEKLGNLAIVETVTIQLRRREPKANSDSNKYSGRKNFKKFTKNQPPKSNFARSYLNLKPADLNGLSMDYGNEFASNHHADELLNIQKNLSKDFENTMNKVSGYRGLEATDIEDEKSDEEDGSESFSFKGRGLSGQLIDGLFIPDDSQLDSQNPRNNLGFTAGKAYGVSHHDGWLHNNVKDKSDDNDEDEDDDEDDDEPKFVFTRR